MVEQAANPRRQARREEVIMVFTVAKVLFMTVVCAMFADDLPRWGVDVAKANWLCGCVAGGFIVQLFPVARDDQKK